MSEAEAIVRDLAARWPILHDATCAYCRFQMMVRWEGDRYVVEAGPTFHAEPCSWARSRRWVAEHPD